MAIPFASSDKCTQSGSMSITRDVYKRQVLKMLEEDDYADFGNTLINFAEKISLTPFPFAAGLGGNMKQMKRCV